MPTLYFRNEKLQFKKFYDENSRILDHGKESFLAIIHSIIKETDCELHAITGRIKNHDECVKKFTYKYKNRLESEGNVHYQIKDYINDLIGIRITLLYEPDINIVGQLLQQEFEVIDLTDKSKLLEKQDNIFGYKGLHLDLKLSAIRAQMSEYRAIADFPFEVQIRTVIQDSWSVLDHKIKYKKAIPRYLERRINSLAALFEIADREFLDIHLASQAEEEKAKNSQHDCTPLNAYTFKRLINERMPDQLPEDNRIGEFVDYILSYGELTTCDLEEMVSCYKDKVGLYFASLLERLGKNFTPTALEYLPHILFMADPKRYTGILPKFSENALREWYQETFNTSIDTPSQTEGKPNI